MNEPSQKPIVLIVDDYRHNLLAMADCLSFDDSAVLTAASAEEALRHLAETDRIAFVLSDISLPGMDGIALLRSIRQEERTRHIPVTLMTATFKDHARAVEAYQFGATDYLEKPIDPIMARAKTRFCIELYRKNQALAAANQEVAALKRELVRRRETA